MRTTDWTKQAGLVRVGSKYNKFLFNFFIFFYIFFIIIFTCVFIFKIVQFSFLTSPLYEINLTTKHLMTSSTFKLHLPLNIMAFLPPSPFIPLQNNSFPLLVTRTIPLRLTIYPNVPRATMQPSSTSSISPSPPICSQCSGTGEVPCTNCSAFGFLKVNEETVWRTCPDCIGTGNIQCPNCVSEEKEDAQQSPSQSQREVLDTDDALGI